jgi:hypothetical protein
MRESRIRNELSERTSVYTDGTMRFMMLRKGDRNSEGGVPPSEQQLAALEQYHDELTKAGVMCSREALQSSAAGARVGFSGRTPTKVDQPIAGAKGVVADFTIIDVPSKADAIAWAKRWPAIDGGGDVEIEVRETACPGGVPTVPKPSTLAPDAAGAKRYAIILKANTKGEADILPEQSRLAAMVTHNNAAIRAGVMLAGEGLQPSSKGARVKFSGGKPAVTDGPFAEAKEMVAGFWLIQVPSKEEAIEWVKAYPYPYEDADVEIREVIDEL